MDKELEDLLRAVSPTGGALASIDAELERLEREARALSTDAPADDDVDALVAEAYGRVPARPARPPGAVGGRGDAGARKPSADIDAEMAAIMREAESSVASYDIHAHEDTVASHDIHAPKESANSCKMNTHKDSANPCKMNEAEEHLCGIHGNDIVCDGTEAVFPPEGAQAGSPPLGESFAMRLSLASPTKSANGSPTKRASVPGAPAAPSPIKRFSLPGAPSAATCSPPPGAVQRPPSPTKRPCSPKKTSIPNGDPHVFVHEGLRSLSPPSGPPVPISTVCVPPLSPNDPDERPLSHGPPIAKNHSPVDGRSPTDKHSPVENHSPSDMHSPSDVHSPNDTPLPVEASSRGNAEDSIGGAPEGVLSAPGVMRAMLQHAQRCQHVARALHALGDTSGALTYARRQRAFEADIGALRSAARARTADALLARVVHVALRVPTDAAIALQSREDVPADTLCVSLLGGAAANEVVRVTCESSALDASSPVQQDVPPEGRAEWRGFAPDAMRVLKFAEHRRLRIDVRAAPDRRPSPRSGMLSSLLALLRPGAEEKRVPPPPDASDNLDRLSDGTVLVASGFVRLAPLLAAHTADADVELAPAAATTRRERAAGVRTLRLRLSLRRALSLRAVQAALEAGESTDERWAVLAGGRSGASFGVADPAPPADMLALDTEDGVLAASYVVLEDELARTTPDTPRAAFLQGRLDALAAAVDTGGMDMEAYAAHVRAALAGAKRLAVERKRAGDIPAAQAWLRRVRLMEGELREVGAL